jgi:penicillin-binding protein-related factor A (putative recombinase)
MTRKQLRQAGRTLAGQRPDLMRVENATQSGTPDVNGCWQGVEFWVELKKVPRPRNARTPVRVPHFTPQQRAWLKTRTRHGGRAFVLIQIGRAYFLHGPEDVDQIGNMTIHQHHQQARLAWSQKEKERWQAALQCLTTT